MKNLHLIPTDKPSRLIKNNHSQLLLTIQTLPLDREIGCFPQNIYITSDEEINQQTEPCWCINTIKNTWDADLIYYQGSMPQYHYVGFKKIILTTDQDLIKEGVQAIDDEFLEWFVKNLNCESVRVEKWASLAECGYSYHITIPQEEPNQLNPKDFGLPQLGTKEFNNLAMEMFGGKPKQETLEEALNKLKLEHTVLNLYPSNMLKNVAELGAKWQAERNYSEAIEFAEWIRIKDFQTTSKNNWIGLDMKYYTTQELFEEFKKK
jgi:hypothetical protein